MITKPQALDRIEHEFPEIANELRDPDWDALIHLQVAVFSRLVQSVIDKGDKSTFQRECRLFLELFDNGEPDLVNTLNVSFLEHLNFQDGKVKRHWAYFQMPAKMRTAFDEMAEYNRRIMGARKF